MKRAAWLRMIVALALAMGCLLLAGAALAQGGDSDGDGVNDEADQCPSDFGLDGAGCPYYDGDDVPDSADACPFENGGVSSDGCPPVSGGGCTVGPVDNTRRDDDCDQIADAEDACPLQSGPLSNNGCPLPAGANADTTDGSTEVNGTSATGNDTPSTAVSIPTVADLNRFTNCVVSTMLAERVRMRAAPSVDAEVVGGLVPGEIYAASLRETTADGDWFQVEGGWVAGWVTQQNAACAELPALGDEIVALPALGSEAAASAPNAILVYMVYILIQIL